MNKQQGKIPQIRFPEFKELWEHKKFGDIFSFRITNSFSRDKLNYRNGDVKNIHYGDIHSKFSTLFDITKEYVPFINPEIELKRIDDGNYCQVGDLVITDASEDYEGIGKSVEIINLNNERLLAGLHTILARPEKSIVGLGFFGYYFKNENFRHNLKIIAQGSKVLSISSSRIAEVVISIPPSISEQTRIASFFTVVDKKIAELKQKKALLEQYKKGVMQKLFSQELRFRDENGKEFPEWEKKKLGELGEFVGGGTPTTKDNSFWNGDIPWLSSSDLAEDSIYKLFPTRFITKEAISKSATKLIPPKSILIISRVGVGKVAINDVGVCTSQDFTNLIPKKDNHLFLAYLIKQQTEKLLAFNQGTSIKGFVKSDLADIRILLPSIKEQDKIANFLSAIDEKINRTETQIQQTQEWKKGLLQKMFC